MSDPGDQIVDTALDDAFRAADAALAGVAETDSRQTIAVRVTLAVLPEILAAVDGELQQARLEVTQARSAAMMARADADSIRDAAREQSRLLRVFFEEIDPAMVATQVAGRLREMGTALTGADEILIQATARHTLRQLGSSMLFALSEDAKTIMEMQTEDGD